MNFQQDYIPNYFPYLYPRQPLVPNDYSNVNNTTNSVTHQQLPSNSQSYSRLRNIRGILNMNESCAHSLVDTVREKNFQSQCLNGTSVPFHRTVDQNLFENDTSGLEVNDLVLHNSGYVLPLAAKLAQLSVSDNGNYSALDNCVNLFANGDPEDDSESRKRSYDNEQSQLSYSSSFRSSNIENSADTDYSYFVPPTYSTASKKSNEYSLFSDSSSSSSTGSSNSMNFSSNYARESSSSSQPSNVRGAENSNRLQFELDKQAEVLNCISTMSKEQLEQMMNMIQKRVVRNQFKEADDREIRSSLPNPQNLRAFSTGWNQELFRNSYSAPHLQQSGAPGFCMNYDKDEWELKARNHHTAAVRGDVQAAFTWHGELPKLTYDMPFSNKVFIGGLPYQITESHLTDTFRTFGNLVVDWPGKDKKERFKGFVYIIFENELQVKLLLKSCRECEGNLYFTLPLRSGKSKDVQIIPWSILDSSYNLTMNPFTKLDAGKTVYIGALHGTMNARGLFRIMDDLFGGVIYTGICVDKHRYPTGSGRVVFNNSKSYMKAISAGFINIVTPKFTKTIQCDPFIEDSPCSICEVQMGPYFCRENGCFRYFCTPCWKAYHKALRLSHNTPLMKNSKLGSTVSPTTNGFSSYMW